MKLLIIALVVIGVYADCDDNCKYLQTCEIDQFVNDAGRVGTFIYPIGQPEQRQLIRTQYNLPMIVHCYIYNDTITGYCPEECIVESSPTGQIFLGLWIVFGFCCFLFIWWHNLSL